MRKKILTVLFFTFLLGGIANAHGNIAPNPAPKQHIVTPVHQQPVYMPPAVVPVVPHNGLWNPWHRTHFSVMYNSYPYYPMVYAPSGLSISLSI